MKKSVIIFFLCVIAFFANNGTILPDIMESRNIITAREMVYDGHWMVPTMNGELRLEKPPLPTWIAAGVEKVMPDNINAQRAMAGIAAMIWVVFFYLLGEKITRNKNYALVATLLFMTCYNVVLMGRTASWDIYCHALMMVAIYLMYRGFYENDRKYLWFPLAGVFLGISFMSKGPVSFYTLLLPFLACVFFFKKADMKGKWLPLVLMIIICIAISSWWYAYILIFDHNAAQHVINKESSSWVDYNVRPWWYYWRFFLETGVWSLLMVTTLAIPYWKNRIEKVGMKREYLFAMGWTLVALVLMSAMPEKKPRYLLPMMVPCCYAMAFVLEYYIFHNCKEKSECIIYYINTGLITLVCFALPVILYVMFYSKHTISLVEFLFLTTVIWTITGVLVYSTIRWKPLTFVCSIAALFASAELFMMPLIGDVANNPKFKSIKETRDMTILKGVPFYYITKEDLRIEMVYEANRKIRPLNTDNKQAVIKALPCVMLTHKRIGEELPSDLLQKIDTVYIGFYDDNRWPKGNRNYNPAFLNYMTLLKLKQK